MRWRREFFLSYINFEILIGVETLYSPARQSREHTGEHLTPFSLPWAKIAIDVIRTDLCSRNSIFAFRIIQINIDIKNQSAVERGSCLVLHWRMWLSDTRTHWNRLKILCRYSKGDRYIPGLSPNLIQSFLGTFQQENWETRVFLI